MVQNLFYGLLSTLVCKIKAFLKSLCLVCGVAVYYYMIVIGAPRRGGFYDRNGADSVVAHLTLPHRM